MFCPRCLVIVFLCSPLAWPATAKFSTGIIRYSTNDRERGDKWKYVSKFAYGIGDGSWTFRARLGRNGTLDRDLKLALEVFLDEKWPAADAEEPCSRNIHKAETKPVVVPPNGAWSRLVSGRTRQHIRPHIWYYALSACDATVSETLSIHYEFKALQEDQSEFSVEMQGMFTVNVLALLGFACFLAWFVRHCRVFFRSAGAVHPVIWTLVAAMSVQFTAQLCHTAHLFFFSFDGVGAKGLEALSEMFFMTSQVIQTSLLILIALGYTLLQSAIGDLDLVIPIACMIGGVHVMLVGVGKIKDDAHYKYHENEGVVGYVLLVLRLVLYLWFLWAIRSTASSGGWRLQIFCRRFGFAGSVYFLAYPVVFFVTQAFAPYLQHKVISVGLLIMQMASNVWLARLFLTRGDYFHVSSLSASELPGGVRIGLMKEE